MEVKQFYNKTISPLVTRTFPCKWSEDDRLCIITEKVLHVFEIKPAPQQAIPILNVSRSFVNSPKTVPGELYADEVLSKIFEWKREDVFSFLMNDVHTPNFPKAKALKPEIVNAFWSPKGLLHPQKCLLAVLTSAGALEIIVQIEKSWISMYELNSHWFRIIDEDFQSLKDMVKVGAECLREQLNRLLITEATWSSLCHGDNDASFSYLVTAHRNAEIAIWKVCRVMTDSLHIDTRVKVEFKFRKKLAEDSIKINKMLWVDLEEDKYLLFIGFYNGHIGVLKLQEFEGGLTSSSYTTCYSHEDGIAIDSMQVLQQTGRLLELLVIKGMYLLVIAVDIFGKMLVLDMKFITSSGLAITGASIINEKCVLITTQDGKICMVKKSHSQILSCVPIRSDIAKEALQYLGFASSRNKLLYVLVSSPSVMYDHLCNREPTNLCFFTLHKLQSEDLLESLYNNTEQSLMNNWDYLDLMKVNALKRGLLPNVKTQSTDLMSLYELKVTYWLLEIMETVRRKNGSNEQQDAARTKEIEQAKSCIFVYSASSYLRLLAERKNVSDIQKLSMSLVRNHLEVWYAGEVEEEANTPLSISVNEILLATGALGLIHLESCTFCKVAITDPWSSECSQGHKLPRCALSRLQVTCTKYRVCPICREIYHPCLDDLASEIRCIYCDVPAAYAHSQIQPELLASSRNLTKDKLIFVGSHTTKDKEKDEEDEA